MTIELESFIASNEDESSVEERIVEYLYSRGFRRGEATDEVRFRRGSFLGTIFGLSPRTWGAEVVVGPVVKDSPGWRVHFLIRTTGQIVSGPERWFWDDEHQAVGDVIRGKEPESTAHVESAIRQMVWTIIGFGVAGAMLGMFVGLAVGLGLKLIGLETWGAGATTCGGVFGAVAGVGFAMARIPR